MYDTISKTDGDCALYVPCSLFQLARVVVCVLVDVVCVIIVILIAHHAVGAVLVAIFVVIFCNWRCTLYTPTSVTVNCVDCYRNYHCTFCTKFFVRLMPQKKTMNNAFVHARAHRPPSPPAHILFFVDMRVMANVVGSSQEKGTTARPGSSSRPRGLSPANADPNRTPAAWRSDFCRESQEWVGKKQKPPSPKMTTQRACVSAPHAMCDVRHTVRARARSLLRYTRKLCALPTMRSCTRAHPPTIPACAHPFFFLSTCALWPTSWVVRKKKELLPDRGRAADQGVYLRPTLTPIAPPLRGAATSAGNPRSGWEKSRSRLRQKWPRSVHVCLRHMQCVMCVTPCARMHAHCYAIHASFVRCQPCVRARARTRPPSPPAHILFFVDMHVMANVVGSSQEKGTTARPGSSSRPRGLSPANADPNRTDSTTLTIRDDESPSADDPGPSADDLPGHPQTTSRPSACRRPPGHPHADDPIKTDTSETFHNKGTAPHVVGSAPCVASKHVAVAIGTVAVLKTVGAAVIVITGAPKASGKLWSHVLDNGSIKCVRDHRCGLHVLRNGERVARIRLQNGCRDKLGDREETLRSRKHSTVSAAASWWVAIGTVAVWRTVGAAVIVVTGVTSTRGWSHVLHIGSGCYRCIRDRG